MEGINFIQRGIDFRITEHDPTKQNVLVSGENIKTVNGESLVGSGNVQANGAFKGWFDDETDLMTRYPSPMAGDFAYVEDASPAQTVSIYKSAAGTWCNSGKKFNPANNQEFESGEQLNQTRIDNTGLENPPENSLPKAEDVMQLKAKLEGVTASETKVQLVTSGEGQNVYNGYINGSTGEYTQSNYNNFIVVPLNGAKSVRWLAKENASNSSNLGWAFGTFSGEIDYTLSTFTALSKGVYTNNPLDNQAVEYIKNALEGVTHAVITIWTYKSGGGSAVTLDNFYCYLESGDSVVDMFEGILGKEEIYDESLSINTNWQVRIGNSSTQMEDAAIAYSSISNAIKTSISEYKGKQLTIAGNSSYNTYYMFLKKNIAAPQSGSTYTLQYLVDNDYLSSYHNVDDTWKASFSVSTVNPSIITIPDDAMYLCVSRVIIQDSSHTRLPKSISVQLTRHIDGVIEKKIAEVAESIPSIVEEQVEPIEEQVDGLNDTVYGEIVERTESLSVETLPTEKISLDTNKIYNFGKEARKQRAYVISVKDWDKVIITPGDYTTYLGLFKKKIPVGTLNSSTILSEYVATGCDGYVPESSVYRMKIYPSTSESTPKGETTIQLSDNAEYLYVQKVYSSVGPDYSPSSIVLYKKQREGGLVEKQSSVTAPSSEVLTLGFGNLDDEGNVIEDYTRLVTGFIPMVNGFYLQLKDGYFVETGMLYDTSGNLLNKDYFKKKNNFTNMFGSAKMLPQFMMRLVIGSDDVINGNDVVSKYFTLSDSRFSRTIPTGLKFKEMLCRLAQLENIVWKNDYRVKYNSSTYFNPATWIGIPYSEAGEYTKYLGMHVSMKTFLTAVLNKRSVLYTEMINSNANESKYGLNYHGLQDLSSTYYGTVCSGLTSYVDGSNNVKFSGSQEATMYARGHRDETTGLSTIEIKENGEWRNATIDELFNLIEPLDMIWNTGHITIVSDVYKDAFGDKQFFVWSEQTTPVGFSTPFTKEALLNRLNYTVNSHPSGSEDWKEWAMYRKEGWFAGHPDMPEENSSKYIQDNFYSYPNELSIDADISTFAGEYAAFSINSDNDNTDSYNNNKAFLNIHRGGGTYDKLQIFNESDDESIATPIVVDISENSGTFIYNSSNIYADDAADKDDWIIIDLTQLSTPLTHGKYKARVVNSSDSEILSGFTHFQMVDISFTAVKGSDDVSLEFSSSEGTPYLVRKEKPDGMSAVVYELTSEDVSSGTKTLNWTGFATYKYVKLFVKADYGVVVKRIDLSV